MTRRVSITVEQGGKGRRRPPVDPENARLLHLRKPTEIAQKRCYETYVVAWPAFRDTPAGLFERAVNGDDGAKGRLFALARPGQAVERGGAA
jgi:hypothetical protein